MVHQPLRKVTLAKLYTAPTSPESPFQEDQDLLKVDIEDFSQIFDAEKSSRGVVQLRATLIGRDAAGATVLLGQKAFGVQVPAPSADAAGGARAIAMATDQALQQLNGWLMAQGR